MLGVGFVKFFHKRSSINLLSKKLKEGNYVLKTMRQKYKINGTA